MIINKCFSWIVSAHYNTIQKYLKFATENTESTEELRNYASQEVELCRNSVLSVLSANSVAKKVRDKLSDFGMKNL